MKSNEGLIWIPISYGRVYYWANSAVTKVARCSSLQTEADDLYYDASALEPDEM